MMEAYVQSFTIQLCCAFYVSPAAVIPETGKKPKEIFPFRFAIPNMDITKHFTFAQDMKHRED